MAVPWSVEVLMVPVLSGLNLSLCPADMYQRNPKHHTKRSVRRRPRFVSKAEVDKLAADLRKCSG